MLSSFKLMRQVWPFCDQANIGIPYFPFSAPTPVCFYMLCCVMHLIHLMHLMHCYWRWLKMTDGFLGRPDGNWITSFLSRLEIGSKIKLFHRKLPEDWRQVRSCAVSIFKIKISLIFYKSPPYYLRFGGSGWGLRTFCACFMVGRWLICLVFFSMLYKQMCQKLGGLS